VSKIGEVRENPFGVEELQDMNDDRVLGLRGHIQNNINILRHKDQTKELRVEIRRLEIELCYVHREAEVRQKRKMLHEEYVGRRSAARGHRGPRGPRGPHDNNRGHRNNSNTRDKEPRFRN